MRVIAGVATIALMLGVLGPSAAQGQETSTQGTQAQSQPAPPAPAPVPSPWSFRVSPYMWFAGVSGDVGVNPNLPTVDVDVNFSEIFKAIDWFPPPVMLAGEVRYGRFAFLSDLMFLGLEGDDSKTRGPVTVAGELDLDMVIWTFGGSFRAVEYGPATLDLLAGGRLWNVDATAKFTGFAARQRSGSETWVDPIIGISGRLELGSGFALQAEGDVGGFGLVSDIDWQVLGTLQYQVSDSVTLDAGYRYLAVDYKNGGFLFDMALSGPIIGASIRF